MQFSNLKSVLIGAGAAATVIAITGAASGSGIGAVFNLGKTNTVNATSILTGSTKHSMLSVTNKGAGTALSLQVAKGKAPFSVNSSVKVPKLNASLLGGLAASQFVQGGGQSRSFGFTMSTTPGTDRTLLSVPGFGTLNADCQPEGGGIARVEFTTGTHTMDAFITSFFNSNVAAGSISFSPHTPEPLGFADPSGVWERLILRYATGFKGFVFTHMASIDLMFDVTSTNCDFDASVIIGQVAIGP